MLRAVGSPPPLAAVEPEGEPWFNRVILVILFGAALLWTFTHKGKW